MGLALRRLFAGGRASIQGTIAELFSYYFKREMVAGPPKQFAALCGIMFSGLATLFLFLGGEGEYGAGDGEGFFITGQVVLGALAVAAGMEAHPPAQRSWPLRLIAHRLVCGGACATQGVFGFCAGCMMFSMAVKLKLVSHHVFDICEDSLDETEEALAEERSWPIGSVVFSWLCDVRTPVLPHLASDDSSIWTHQRTTHTHTPIEMPSFQSVHLL